MLAQAGACRGDGVRVAVDGEHFRADLPQQRGVATPADGGIDGAATAHRPSRFSKKLMIAG